MGEIHECWISVQMYWLIGVLNWEVSFLKKWLKKMITIRDEKVLNWLSRFSYAHAAIAVPKLK